MNWLINMWLLVKWLRTQFIFPAYAQLTHDSTQDDDFAARFETVFHQKISTAHIKHMSYNLLYILIYNFKIIICNFVHCWHKQFIHSAYADISAVLVSLSDFQINQLLCLQKNNQITLKKKTHAQHKTSLDYSSSILAHIQCVSANSAQAQHVSIIFEHHSLLTLSYCKWKIMLFLVYTEHMQWHADCNSRVIQLLMKIHIHHLQ